MLLRMIQAAQQNASVRLQIIGTVLGRSATGSRNARGRQCVPDAAISPTQRIVASRATEPPAVLAIADMDQTAINSRETIAETIGLIARHAMSKREAEMGAAH
jgi:hypothetical protein